MNNINLHNLGSNVIYPVRQTSWTTTYPSLLAFLKNSISAFFYQRHKCFRILIDSADGDEIGFQFVKLFETQEVPIRLGNRWFSDLGYSCWFSDF